MYKVIIVDDESIIRKGLRETIEWDSLGLEISGEAGDGIEALALVKTIKPHILITDIKIPGMDGIELIKEIKSLGLNIRIIIMSGYSDYAFLKEAIKLGAQSYLLKPIDNDELISNLIDSVNSIEKEIFQNIQQHQGDQLLRANTLNRLVTNGINLREFEEKASFLDIALEAEQYLCAACMADTAGGSFNGDEPLALFAVHNICEELMQGAGLSFISAQGLIVCLFLGSRTDAFRDTANAVLSDITRRVLEYLGIFLLAGVGMPVSVIGDIWKSYDSAIQSLEYGIFTKDTGIIRHGQIVPSGLQMERKIHINYDLIKNAIRFGKRDEFYTYANEIFQILSSEDTVSINHVRNFIMRLVIKIMGIYRELAENVAEQATIDFDYAGLLKVRKIDDLWQWFNLLCDKLFAETRRFQGKGGRVSSHVVSYVEDHYNEVLSLSQIADIYQVNTSYLGQIFKKEMGESFTDYVNRYRIQKARELLAGSNLKVYEIAEKVGFTDYRYFLKIFKKITGINPTEIRS